LISLGLISELMSLGLISGLISLGLVSELISLGLVQNMDSEFPGENVLLVTVTDEESRRIELQSDEETLVEIMVVLRTMFGNNVPDATSIYVPRWNADRLFKGSYSNWPIGVDSDIFLQLQVHI